MERNPWGDGTPWKNSTAFFTYLRGCLRKAWANNPIKHDLIKSKRYQIANPNPKGKKPTVWGALCEMCGLEYPLAKIQVDHITPAGKLNKTEDIQGFVERLLYVTEEDLRLVCVDCNASLAYADKHSITFEEALTTKQAIALCKENKDKQWLIDKGITPASSQIKRRQQIIEELSK